MPKKGIVILLAFLLLIVGSAVFLSHSQQVMFGISQEISGELTKALGQNVKIGSIRIRSFRELSLSDVSIEDQDGELLGQSREVNLVFSLRQFLFGGQSAASMIEAIDLVSPQIFLWQDAAGAWNIEKLFQTKTSGQSPLKSTVTIEQGELTVTLSQGKWVLSDLNGTADLAQFPAVAMTLKGTAAGQTFSLEGFIKDKENLQAELTAPKVEVSPFLPLVAEVLGQNGLDIHGGQLEDVTVVVKKNKGSLLFSGESAVKQAAFSWQGEEFSQGSAFLTFTSDKINLYGGKAEFDGQPFALSGEVYYSGAEPVFSAALTTHQTELARLPLAKIGLNQPLSGLADLNILVQGTAKAPDVAGSVNVNKMQLGNYAVDHVYGQFHYSDQKLAIHKFSLLGFGGNASGAGTVDFARGQTAFQLSGWHIDTSLLEAALQMPLTGYADFSLAASGPLAVDQLTVFGQVSMQAGTVQGIDFQSLAATGQKNSDGSLLLQAASAKIGGGSISLSAAVRQGQLTGSIWAQDINAAPLAAAYSEIPVKGTFSLGGQLGGSLNEPTFTGQVLGEQGSLASQPFDQLSGRVHVSQNRLYLDEVNTEYHRQVEKSDPKLLSPEIVTRYHLTGSIEFTGEQRIDLTAALTKGRAEDLVAVLAPGERLTGNIDADLRLTGTIKQPEAFMAANFTDGSYRGYIIRQAEALVQHHQGVTTVDHLKVRAVPANFELSGTIDANKQMNFAVDIKNIRLNRLFVELPYPVTGRGDFAGQLTGTPDDPVFTGELTAQNVKVKGQPITGVLGHVILDKRTLTVPDLTFSQGGGTFRLRGGLDLIDKTMGGVMEVTNASVSTLMPFFDLPPDQVTGLFNGEMQAYGAWDNPTASLRAKLDHGTIKHYPLENIDIDLSLANHVVTVNHFQAQQGNGRLVVTGSADLKGQINLNVFGNQIDSGLFSAWYDTKVPVHGEALIAMTLTGDTKAPQAAVSIGITNGSIQDQSFDTLSGSFIVTPQQIDINQITLTKNSYVASATGKIPLKSLSDSEIWPNLSPITNSHYSQVSKKIVSDGEMDLKIMLDQADLGILPLLTKRVAWATGQTQGIVYVNGTLDNPKVSGDFTVLDGVIKFSDLKEPLQNLSIAISLQGDKIVVNTFQGTMGKGGFTLNGSAAIRGRSLADYAFNLYLNALEIDHRNFKGPVSASLQLMPKAGKPLLSGKMLFERDQIDIPMIPDMEPTNFDMGLDVTVEAGKNVRFYNPYMYDFYVEGKTTFGGTWQKLEPTGRFTVSRGQLTYFTAPFKIVSGSAEFTPYNGLMPVIKLTSYFQIQQINLAQQTTVTLGVNGPANAMNFKLSANPPMSQEAILSLLTLRSRYFERQSSDTSFGVDQVGSVVSSGIEAQLFSPVENTLKDFFGVDDFHIVRSTDYLTTDGTVGRGSRDVYNVEISKYLTDRFSINLSRGVDNSSQKIGVLYQFNEHVSSGLYYDSVKKTQFNILTRYAF
ncbi:MAG: translocation/assembly module TamB domain-containing protein [Sporomusaceae bacterium]|nr:translocation/assembly module TamB domain-containing protein [Sporomusaceae bacterium]